MSDALLTTFTQFGAAGLIGLLWLLERRAAAQRERQLDEAHRTVMARQQELDALLSVIRENTQALSSLQQSQRRLVEVLERLRDRAAAAPA
jgi:hypothetical protein